jgi:hypothetical protein
MAYTYMSCPQCGLRIRLRAPYLVVECCPRCIALSRRPVAMKITDRRPETTQTFDNEEMTQ